MVSWSGACKPTLHTGTGQLRSATRLQHRMYASTNVCAVQVCLYTIPADYNAPLQAGHCYSDDDRYDLVSWSGANKPTLLHTGPLRSATRLQRRMYASTNVCAVKVCSYTILADYNAPLEAAHCYSDDDRYDLMA